MQTHGQNTENAPVEETELNYPVRVTQLSLVEDSDGAGRFRGGLGLRKDFLFDRPTTFTVLADRTKSGPLGAFGGLLVVLMIATALGANVIAPYAYDETIRGQRMKAPSVSSTMVHSSALPMVMRRHCGRE